MSYNQGTITTEYVDPTIYVENNRCSFELDGTKEGYLPNMRLLNIGISQTAGVTGAYNRLLGALSVIKNIRLMDGRTELSALRAPREYMAFQSQLRTNSDNKSSACWEKRNALGMEIFAANEKLKKVYEPPGTTDDPDTTASGYLDLREVFPILNALPVLPTSVFQNLKIEIEFISSGTQQIITNVTHAPLSVRPILAVDSVEDPRLLMPLVKALKERGGRWNEIESDRFSVAGRVAEIAGTVQETKAQSMGFIGKRVERLLMVKTLQSNAETVNGGVEVMGYGNLGSQALLNEQMQVRLNGKNVIPGFNGITKPNERLAIVADEYGPSSAFPGSNLYKWSNGDVLVDWNAVGGAAQYLTGKAFGGSLSYDCVRIGARVADLAISLSRQFDADPGSATTAPASTNLPLTVNMYAEIDKAISVNPDGSYRIVYV